MMISEKMAVGKLLLSESSDFLRVMGTGNRSNELTICFVRCSIIVEFIIVGSVQ